MEGFITFLQNKKTHLVVLVYVLLKLFTGGGDEAGVLEGFNTDNLVTILPTLIVSTLKAAWDRKQPG